MPNPQTASSATQARVVIVDDDVELRVLLQDYLSGQGHEVTFFSNAMDALRALGPTGPLAATQDAGDIDVLISDIQMPGMDGLELTSQLQALRPEIPIILSTAFGTIETAIEAMRRGAFHYIVKPVRMSEMSMNISRAFEHRKLSRDNHALRMELKKDWELGTGKLIGKSTAMQSVFDLVRRVSQVSANVLITGESGTGKEQVARAVHEMGPRSKKPFVAINCSAIPETLLESELFGHAKGSFTGAAQRKLGLFEAAQGGTLFLDEIGDMAPALQAKLLRVLQEKQVRAVGDTQAREIDVRIIAATHHDLKSAIKSGRFREDLYYRLSVIPIELPPLRDRTEDIPSLAQHFLSKFAAINSTPVKGFTKRAMSKLMRGKWEGNVRELENVVERACVLATQSLIDENDLPTSAVTSPDTFFTNNTQDWPTVDKLEERYIRLVLQKTDGRKDQAAKILGINRRTLYRKEREYGLVPVTNGRNEGEGQDG
jgi:two-component system response regulator HydG